MFQLIYSSVFLCCVTFRDENNLFFIFWGLIFSSLLLLTQYFNQYIHYLFITLLPFGLPYISWLSQSFRLNVGIYHLYVFCLQVDSTEKKRWVWTSWHWRQKQRLALALTLSRGEDRAVLRSLSGLLQLCQKAHLKLHTFTLKPDIPLIFQKK